MSRMVVTGLWLLATGLKNVVGEINFIKIEFHNFRHFKF
jgi:hypothetical protein